MATPLLIDTDMGIDDAVAIALALSSPDLALVGVTSVGGNVALDQATANVGRLLAALKPKQMPHLGRGLDQAVGRQNAQHVFGADGLGESDLAVPADFQPGNFIGTYERCIAEHGAALNIVAIGPLTNLAALLRDRPGLLEKAGRIIIMGGAIWCPGNITPAAEFNFYRDPEAAKQVFAAGLPITLVPLDVTRQVALDESHVAHLSRSGRNGGELLARMVRWTFERRADGPGQFIIHDAVAVGAILWPELFLRSRIAVEILTRGDQAGRSKPLVVKDKSLQAAVVLSVNVGDFLENLLELICEEEFIV